MDVATLAMINSKATKIDKTACTLFGQFAATFTPTIDSAWHTLVSISGKRGYLDKATLYNSNPSYPLTFRVTIDGVVKFYGACITGFCGMVAKNSGDFVYNGASLNMVALATNNSGLTFSLFGASTGYYWENYTVNSGTGQVAYNPDSWYFTNSVLIEYMGTNAAITSAWLQYQGGSY